MSDDIVLNPAAPRALPRQEPFGVLDIGTTKMCCLIARPGPGGGVQLLGARLPAGRGAARRRDRRRRGGRGLDPGGAARGRAAGRRDPARDLARRVGGGRPSVELRPRRARARTAGRSPVPTCSCARPGRGGGAPTEREVLHAVPVEISARRRAAAARSARHARPRARGRGPPGHGSPQRPCATSLAAVERCHVEVGGVVPSTYAAGLACLAEDEPELGCLVLDSRRRRHGRRPLRRRRACQVVQPCRSAATTSPATSPRPVDQPAAGRADQDPLRQRAVSRCDDARQHSRSRAWATRRATHRRDRPRARLTEIIRPRVEEILALVRRAPGRAPRAAGRRPPRSIVLTGGGSQLEGDRSSWSRRSSAAGALRPPRGLWRRARQDRRLLRRRPPAAVAAGARRRRRTRPGAIRSRSSALSHASCETWPMVERELLSTCRIARPDTCPRTAPWLEPNTVGHWEEKV